MRFSQQSYVSKAVSTSLGYKKLEIFACFLSICIKEPLDARDSVTSIILILLLLGDYLKAGMAFKTSVGEDDIDCYTDEKVSKSRFQESKGIRQWTIH